MIATILVSVIGAGALVFAAWLGRKVVNIQVNVNHRLDEALGRLDDAHARITTSQVSGRPVPEDS